MTELEVKDLRAQVFEDDVVTKEEFLMLCDKKDEQKETSSEFDTLYAQAGFAFVTADGYIDDGEATLLIEKIGEDGNVDTAEDELLCLISDWVLDGGEVSNLLVEAFPDYFDVDDSDDEE